jgi:hypothetical protein
VINSATQQIQSVDAVLQTSSNHAHIWTDADASVAPETIERIARRFDNQIYIPVRSRWGSEPSPGIDGDPRIHLLFTRFMNPAVAGYFAGDNTYAAAAVPVSNEHEMLIFHINVLQFSDARLDDVLAHEFQHMIRYTLDRDEAAWMNEGFSMMAAYLIGAAENDGFTRAFLGAPQTSLTRWNGQRSDYGASFLWMLYFYEQYGAEAFRQLSDSPQTGLAAHPADSDDSRLFLADWVLANRLQRPDTRYGYRGLSLPPATSIPVTVPDTRTGTLPATGTHYYHLSSPASNQMALSLELELPDTMPLIADTPPNPQRMFWYSQRGDMQNPRLTHPLDLRDIPDAQTARLDFSLWYALESGWDYAYLSISQDGGTTWQPQRTSLSTDDNPQQQAYGVGYTGHSSGWQQQTLALDAFVGQQIQIRFEVVTDETIHEAGLALADDVMLRLPDGTVQPLDSWQSDGFVRTRNQTPVDAWLQVAQTDDTDTVQVSRWYMTNQQVTPAISILPDAASTDISITPFTRSMLPVAYTLYLRPVEK